MSAELKLAELLAAREKSPAPAVDPTEELETVALPETVQRDGQGPAKTTVSSKNLFQHHDAHPVVLDLALLHRYGPDWYIWEAETLQHRIEQDFGRAPSDLAFSKIQAVRALHLVDTFWKQWEVFCWCTMPFNDLFPDFEVMQVPTVAQCMVSVDVANQLRDDVEWHSEVVAYLESVHRHDGIFVSQPPLDFVHVDAAGLVVDPSEVKLLWPAVLTTGRMPSAGTITAEQLRRMLVAYRFLEDHRRSLRAQLPLVTHA